MNELLYGKQLKFAAKRLAALPRTDGGWGLTPSSASSIVNTAEAAVVLRAAGYTDLMGARIVDYLGAAIPMYCQPEPASPGQGYGRGERTRFVSFGLEGLTTFPEQTFGSDTALEAIDFSLNFLHVNELNGGWPETRGEEPDSIHQTSRVISSLIRLLLSDEEHGKLSPLKRRRAVQMAERGGQRLLELQQIDGSWPIRPGATETPSPTKTALATVALGYLAHISNSSEIDSARQDGGRWLLTNLRSWDGRTEEDTDEQGTHWIHLAYAECVRGVLAGFQESPRQLKPVFDRLVRGWSEKERLWTEPGMPEGKATIRAAYHTVMAFESARSTTQLLVPRPLPQTSGSPLGELTGVSVSPEVVVLHGTTSHADLTLTPGPMRTLQALVSHGGKASTLELSQTSGKRTNSIYQDIKLINERAASASYGGVANLIRSERSADGTYSYSLAAPLI